MVRSSRKTVSTNGEPICVETVDECFFGMPIHLLHELKFNEEICDNWHMYAVEICLHNQCQGGNVCVVKADITHLSPGKISRSYVQTLYKIIEYYKDKGLAAIWTTCAKVDITKPYRAYVFIWYMKHVLLNKVIRPIKDFMVR